MPSQIPRKNSNSRLKNEKALNQEKPSIRRLLPPEAQELTFRLTRKHHHRASSSGTNVRWIVRRMGFGAVRSNLPRARTYWMHTHWRGEVKNENTMERRVDLHVLCPTPINATRFPEEEGLLKLATHSVSLYSMAIREYNLLVQMTIKGVILPLAKNHGNDVIMGIKQDAGKFLILLWGHD